MLYVRYGFLMPDELPPQSIKRSCTIGASVPKSFYDKLIESVKREGFRNPVLFDNLDEMKVIYGESRTWVAHKLQIPLPAFINDGRNNFNHFEEIYTEQQALSKFKDKPAKFRLGPPMFFFGCNN